MATFNVDSLEFQDDEEARLGTDADFGVSYDSGNDALEIEDRVNSAIASIPRSTGTDLVGGNFAETVSEGKALADDGNVYDSIQGAVNNASSWVKIGPGTFNESVVVDTAGLTIEGSGERTIIDGGTNTGIYIGASNITTSSVFIKSNVRAVQPVDGATAENFTISNCKIISTKFTVYGYNGSAYQSGWKILDCNLTTSGDGDATIAIQDNSIIVNNSIESLRGLGIAVAGGFGGTNNIIAYNTIEGGDTGIDIDIGDSIIYGNRVTVSDSSLSGSIRVGANDSIVAKNRVGPQPITNTGTGNIFDSNLVTE